MKDSYSFDIDAAGLDVSYQKHRETYQRIFDRCGLNYLIIDAHSGAMGGSQSEEFMVYTPAGEDQVVSCANCKYAANLEKATSKLDAVEDLKPEGDGKPLEVHTPGHEDDRGCRALSWSFAEEQDQNLALMIDSSTGEDARAPKNQSTAAGNIGPRAVVVLMRGDHQLNEAKLSTALAGKETRPMEEEEIQQLFGSPAGFLGPLGVDWAKNLDDKQRAYSSGR